MYIEGKYIFIFAANTKPIGQIFTLIYLPSGTPRNSTGETKHKTIILSRICNSQQVAEMDSHYFGCFKAIKFILTMP